MADGLFAGAAFALEQLDQLAASVRAEIRLDTRRAREGREAEAPLWGLCLLANGLEAARRDLDHQVRAVRNAQGRRTASFGPHTDKSEAGGDAA